MLGDGTGCHPEQDQRAWPHLSGHDFWHHLARTLGQHLARPGFAPIPAVRRNGERLVADYLTPDTAREAEENPLLRAWGYAGRDFMALLGGYEVVHPSLEVPAWADPAEGAHGQWLLQRLQSDLFHRRATPGGGRR